MKTKRILLTLLAVVALLPAVAKGQNNKKMKTIELTQEQFLERVYDLNNTSNELKYLGDKPALVDFYASWCGPCKALAPILEELAADYEGEVIIYKVNTEREQEIAQAFNIRSIPTLLFIPMSGKPTMAQGAMPKADLKKTIDSLLLGK